MRILLTTAVALSVLGSVHTPSAKETPVPRLIDWSLEVMANDDEVHKYAVSRNGGTIPVEIGAWTCKYDQVKVDTEGVRTESTAIYCMSGKVAAATHIVCALAPGGEHQSANLIIRNGKKGDLIRIKCDATD
jgi:hypothetical protein